MFNPPLRSQRRVARRSALTEEQMALGFRRRPPPEWQQPTYPGVLWDRPLNPHFHYAGRDRPPRTSYDHWRRFPEQRSPFDPDEYSGQPKALAEVYPHGFDAHAPRQQDDTKPAPWHVYPGGPGEPVELPSHQRRQSLVNRQITNAAVNREYTGTYRHAKPARQARANSRRAMAISGRPVPAEIANQIGQY